MKHIIYILLASLLATCGSNDVPLPDQDQPDFHSLNILFDDVQGLNTGDPVVLRGVEVGAVKEISFLGENNDTVNVNIELYKHEIRRHAEFIVGSNGLMGGMKITIVPNEAPTRYSYHSNDHITGIHERGIKEHLIALLDSANLHTDFLNDEFLGDFLGKIGPLKLSIDSSILENKEGDKAKLDSLVDKIKTLVGEAKSDVKKIKSNPTIAKLIQRSKTKTPKDTILIKKSKALFNKVDSIYKSMKASFKEIKGLTDFKARNKVVKREIDSTLFQIQALLDKYDPL